MNALRTIWSKLRSLWQRGEVNREIDEELRFHLEQRVAENIAAGPSPEDAAREARKCFGNMQSVREECRETRGAAFGETFWQDVRFGLRLLRKTPGFTAMAVFSLAVGIGLNATVFSALDAILLRPISFKDPASIVRVANPDFCYPDYREISGQCHSLSGVAAVCRFVGHLRRAEGVETLTTEIVSPNYFSVLGVGAAVGNVFSERDSRLSGESVVVISHRLWRSHFHSDSAIVGQTISLVDGSYTILGVAQPGYEGVSRFPKVDLWFPVDKVWAENRLVRNFSLVGRCAPATPPGQVQAELQTLVGRLQLKDPKTSQTERVLALSEADFNRTNPGGRVAVMVMAFVGLVLLVACGNVSSMLLARHEQRRREMAVRQALGAGRRRLVRQLLAESLVLATLGAGFGLLLMAWARNGLLPLLIPPGFHQLFPEFQLDHRVLELTVVLALLATLAFGLAPAWRAAGTELATILKGQVPPAGRRWSLLRGRNAMVVGQLAVSTVFLVTVGLLARAFVQGNAVDPGFARKPMLQLRLHFDDRAGADYWRSCEQLLAHIQPLPGVRGASLATAVPLAEWDSGALKTFLPGDEGPDSADGQEIGYSAVAPNYFQTMGIRLLRGRPFNERDGESGAQVVIISETMARRCWPGADPIGRSVHLGQPTAASAEIVGIARDVVRLSIGGKAEPFLYVPLRQWTAGYLTLLVETTGDRSDVLGLVRREIHSLGDPVEILSVDTQQQLVRKALLPQWVAGWLFGVLGLLAFTLALAGLYGVISYSVARRTHEIGVRLALGAPAGGTTRMILRQGLVLALIGLAVGLPAAFGLGWTLRSLLFGLSPADPATFLGASGVIITVALLASYFPARRAARVNPMEALRCE